MPTRPHPDLESRLAEASDPSLAVRAIVEDLRRAGHELWSWDESSDFSIWGDDYANPPSRNGFMIEMRWPDFAGEEPGDFAVVVTFGPWPSSPIRCSIGSDAK